MPTLTIQVDPKSPFHTTERINIFPISRGPYSGVDYIHMEAIDAGRFGAQSLRRVTAKGDEIQFYGRFKDFLTACQEVERIISDQQEKDSIAVYPRRT